MFIILGRITFNLKKIFKEVKNLFILIDGYYQPNTTVAYAYLIGIYMHMPYPRHMNTFQRNNLEMQPSSHNSNHLLLKRIVSHILSKSVPTFFLIAEQRWFILQLLLKMNFKNLQAKT